MRWLIAGLVAVGLLFIALLVFWPSGDARSQRPDGFAPNVPGWLADLLPDPPAAKPRDHPPKALAAGHRWSGRFFAEDGSLGVVRFHLSSGPELKIIARAPGSDDQTLCVAAADVSASCEEVGKDQRGSIVVRERDADVILEATQGDITFAIND